MINLNDLVPLPGKDGMNKGLSSASESTMMKTFGVPGPLTPGCSDANSAFVKKLVFGVDVGPFKVSGLVYAVESLQQIFAQVKNELPAVYAAVKTAGVLCIRSRRQDPAVYSNHSWGTAIDIYFGIGVVPQGMHQTQRGVYLLYPYFNNHGWYWGAAFSGKAVDSMHIELAEETIKKMPVATMSNVVKKKRGKKNSK